jgi:hypothetical protein
VDSLLWISFTYFTIGFAPEPTHFFRHWLILFMVHQMALSQFLSSRWNSPPNPGLHSNASSLGHQVLLTRGFFDKPHWYQLAWSRRPPRIHPPLQPPLLPLPQNPQPSHHTKLHHAIRRTLLHSGGFATFFSSVLTIEQRLREIATFISNVDVWKIFWKQKATFKRKTLLQCS